jgi:hypothetical protein
MLFKVYRRGTAESDRKNLWLTMRDLRAGTRSSEEFVNRKSQIVNVPRFTFAGLFRNLDAA